jgi:hypothetical protein
LSIVSAENRKISAKTNRIPTSYRNTSIQSGVYQGKQ